MKEQGNLEILAISAVVRLQFCKENHVPDHRGGVGQVYQEGSSERVVLLFERLYSEEFL